MHAIGLCGNPLGTRPCQILMDLLVVPSPSLYLNSVYVVLWSLGPAEPPPSSVFRYNGNKLLTF